MMMFAVIKRTHIKVLEPFQTLTSLPTGRAKGSSLFFFSDSAGALSGAGPIAFFCEKGQEHVISFFLQD